MKPLQVVKEQSLISKAKPMGETEEGRTDHHHGRADRAKRNRTGSTKWRRPRSTKRRRPSGTKTVTKEKASPGEAEGMETEFSRKAERTEGKSRAVKMVMRAKERLVEEMLLMAEFPEMTHSRMAKVARSALETACAASHAKSSYAMCPDLYGKTHRNRKDEQCCGSLFHSFRPFEGKPLTLPSRKRGGNQGEDLLRRSGATK